MYLEDLIRNKRLLLTHEPVLANGYTNEIINKFNYRNCKYFYSVTIEMAQENDYRYLWIASQNCKNVFYIIKGHTEQTRYNPNEYYPELEQFMRSKIKADLTLDKTIDWFKKNSNRYNTLENKELSEYIALILNKIKTDHLDLYNEYVNLCNAVGYTPKPFTTRTSNIDEFNKKLAWVHDNKEEEHGYDGSYGGYYDNAGLYNETGYAREPQKRAERRISSYNSKCKESYNIANPEDVINVIALSYYVQDETEMLNVDTYKCKCGRYLRYRTTQVQQDANTGFWKTYPDTEACCPTCGALKKER